MWQLWLPLDMIWIGKQFQTRQDAVDYRLLATLGQISEIFPDEAMQAEIHLNHVVEPGLEG